MPKKSCPYLYHIRQVAARVAKLVLCGAFKGLPYGEWWCHSKGRWWHWFPIGSALWPDHCARLGLPGSGFWPDSLVFWRSVRSKIWCWTGQLVVRFWADLENCTKFDQLILSKIIKIVATSCHISRLKCTNSILADPAGGAYSTRRKILQNINTKQTQPFYKNTDMCYFMGSCFLTDRTNGRAYATVLCPSSSSVCDVMYCGLTVRPRAKVTIDSL